MPIPPDADERYADRFYLAAEVVSASDKTVVEAKREIYRKHEFCKCILALQQDRYEVLVELRTAGGDWRQQLLTEPDDLLVLPEFGLRCKLSDLYRGTALQRRQLRR